MDRIPLKPYNLLTPSHRVPLPLHTPSDERKPKRQSRLTNESPNKRVKLTLESASDVSEDSDGDYYESDDQEMDDSVVGHAQSRRYTEYGSRTNFMMSLPAMSRRILPSTHSILRSFVSSHKSDVYKCQSASVDGYLTPPYACSYSHAAKNGGTPHLAVATEQGSVHILNTSKRVDWDVEPIRTTLQPHHNGIFNVKWNHFDTHLATCSGDQSTRITCVETNTITHVLQGHNSTVKCMAWDPSHSDLLASGGRDGAICLWDLRLGNKEDDDGLIVSSPVVKIPGAHEDSQSKGKSRPRKGKQPASRSVTNVLYSDTDSYGIVSSGSFDGILRCWDLRVQTSKRTRATKHKVPTCIYSSPIDPTTLRGSRRPRGIVSLTSGSGPTAGLLFGLGADSRIHTYAFPSLSPQPCEFADQNLQASSFYVGIAVSPCGQWLASGSAGKEGRGFLFDVSNACRPSYVREGAGVGFKGQMGEVGAVDWAQGMLATCADDGTVRVWRPDVEVHNHCVEEPEESKWDWSWST